MRIHIFANRNKGQSLVFIAVLSVALFGMLALSLDFGYSMYNRRWAQNAADSAALAAARILCQDSSVNRIQNAKNEAQAYAETYNRAFGVISQTLSEVCIYGDPTPQAACAGVTLDKGQARAVVSIQHPTFVANLFSTNSITVPATATAGCFAPGAVQGAAVIPVAWKCDQITCSTNPTTGDTECQCGGLNFTNSNTCTFGTDTEYIFFDQDPGAAYYWCGDTLGDTPPEWGPVPTVNGLPDPNAIPIDCDAPNGASPEVYPISPINPNHKWFWVNTDGGNCDSTELVQIVRNGLTSTMFTHWWYPECGGDKGTVYDNLDDYRDPSTVIVPVFDRQCQIADPLLSRDINPCYAGVNNADPNDPDPRDVQDLNTDERQGAAQNSQTNWYHMSGAAVLNLMCVEDPNSRCDRTGATLPQWDARQWLEDRNPSGQGNQSKIGNENSFEGCFVTGYVPGLIGRPSDGVQTGAWTIYLVK